MVLGWNVLYGPGNSDSKWSLYHEAFLETPKVFFGLNWLALFYAQYQREIIGLTAFTDSKNLMALTLNIAWNIAQTWV